MAMWRIRLFMLHLLRASSLVPAAAALPRRRSSSRGN
jgi:hypothetical protein